jgi:hypothetical protein
VTRRINGKFVQYRGNTLSRVKQYGKSATDFVENVVKAIFTLRGRLR